MRQRLFTPGPTPVPETIQLDMAQPMIHHRNEDFQSYLTSCHDKLKYLFQTKNPVVILTGSGTASLDSIVSSIHEQNDEAIFVNGGKFGERWGEILSRYQIPAHEIKVEWGKSVSFSQVSELLDKNKNITTVYLTHSETSTGTYTDVKNLTRQIKSNFPDVFVIVDGITSIGSHEMKFDEWEIDAVCTGSQKGLMIPPGLAFIAVSDNLLDKLKRTKPKSFYLSLHEALKAQSKNDTPWTPAVSLFVGLKSALDMIEKEGIEKVWQRHFHLGESVRLAMKALGLKLFSESPSNAVTPVWLPTEVEWKNFNNHLKKMSGITIAGGQDQFAGKIFRISHLGYYDSFDMLTVVAAIERALKAAGYHFEVGVGVLAVHTYLMDKGV